MLSTHNKVMNAERVSILPLIQLLFKNQGKNCSWRERAEILYLWNASNECKISMETYLRHIHSYRHNPAWLCLISLLLVV